MNLILFFFAQCWDLNDWKQNIEKDENYYINLGGKFEISIVLVLEMSKVLGKDDLEKSIRFSLKYLSLISCRMKTLSRVYRDEI